MEGKPTIAELIIRMTEGAKMCDAAQQALDEIYGIQFVDGYTTRSYQEPRISIHVYRGINEIIEAIDLNYEDKLASKSSAPERTVEVNNTTLFQLGTETGYYYREAKEHEA